MLTRAALTLTWVATLGIVNAIPLFYARRLAHNRARAVLRVLCKLHNYSAKKWVNFVQFFSPKTLDKCAPMWYNKYVIKRERVVRIPKLTMANRNYIASS